MSMFRVKHVDFEERFNVYTDSDTLHANEWEDASRLKEQGWESRYDYEAEVIIDVIKGMAVKEFGVNTILEVGSGPGVLSQKLQARLPALTYHLVDKPYAEKYFKDNNFKGTFFVKDISLDLDKTELLPTYDLIICNDTLEHLLAPTNVIKRFYELTTEESRVFISVPNWRMAHQFIYRGLWDYDNFLYLMYTHKFNVIDVYPSILQTPPYPKLSSESEMPDELIQSWNWYFNLKKRL
jgi:hypothetical protein